MREITDVSELKSIQLHILRYVKAFCDSHEIKYWLTAGTLLGAVRHQGYIPWDDDIDIGMTRDNFDRFRLLFNKETDGRYMFSCPEDDPKYCYQMAKVFDKNTVLYEPNKKSGYKISVYIDVFVYDNIPNDRFKVARLYNRRDTLKHIRAIRNSDKHGGNAVRVFLVSALGRLLKLIPTEYLVQKIATNGMQYRQIETGYYGDLVGSYSVIIDKEIIGNYAELEFEGEMYSVPEKYDEWLSLFFGDYMKLPPIEKRVSEHRFEAYIK